MHNTALSLVVPCYNEQGRLPVEEFRRFALQHSNCQFIMVDDGSSDKTIQLLNELRAACPARFEVVRLTRNSGKAEAVRQGVLHVLNRPTKLFGYWDADGAAPLEILPRLWTAFDEYADLQIVLGVRVRTGRNQIRRQWARRIFSRVNREVSRSLLGHQFVDTGCGAKLFRMGERTHSLFHQPFSTRWLFDVEILARFLAQHPNRPMRRAHDEIREVPLTEWHEMTESKLTPPEMVRAGAEILRLWRMSPKPASDGEPASQGRAKAAQGGRERGL